MKQSQNAITFLKAQYSAIYGRAYVKGLASVMVLSSAVAATYAQAADITSTGETWDKAIGFNTEDYNDQQPSMVNGDTYNLSQGSFGDITANDADHDVNLNNVQLKGTLSVQSGSTANIRNNLFSWDHATTGMDGASNAEGDLDTSGKVTIGSSSNSSQAYFNTVNLQSGSNVQISNKFDSNQTLDQHSSLTGGLGPNGSFNAAAGSAIGLNSNSNITIGAGSNDAKFDGKVVFRPTEQGSNSYIRVEDDLNGTVASSNNAAWSSTAPSATAQLEFGDSSEIIVQNGKSGTAGIYAPNAKLGGQVTIGSGGTLRLDGDFIYDNDIAANAKHGKGNFTTTANTNINIVSGGKLVVGNGSYDNAPAYAQNAEDYQGETTVDLSNAKAITGTGNLEVQGTAILTDTLLEDFVQADVSNTTAKGGTVVLSGGTLALSATGNNSVDLSKYRYDTADNERRDVDIVLAGNGNDTIKGQNITVSKALTTTTAAKNQLNIEAEHLTLGDASAANVGALNFKQATVSKQIDFKSGDTQENRVVLSNKVVVNAIKNGADDKAISTGTVYIKQDTLNKQDPESLFQVEGGELTHKNGSIALSDSGNLTIGGVTDSKNQAYGEDATLIISDTANFKLGNNSEVNIISNGSGAVSTLDLTKAQELSHRSTENSRINVGSDAAGSTDVTTDARLILKDTQFNSKKFFNIRESDGWAAPNDTTLGVFVKGTGAVQINDTPDDGQGVLLDLSALGKADNRTSGNGIYFDQGGRIEIKSQDDNGNVIDGDLRLTQTAGGSNGVDRVLNIGRGTISANSIQINNKHQTNRDYDDLVIETGTLEVGSKLASENPTDVDLVLGNSASTTSTTDGAHLYLGNANTTQGTIDTNIRLNADADSQDSATLEVKAGEWTLSQDRNIAFEGRGTINVGSQTETDRTASLNMETQTLDVTYDNIVNVNATGTLRVNELKVEDTAKVTINGDLHINSGDFTSGDVLEGSGNLFVGEVGYNPNAGTPYPEATVAFNKANLEGFVGDNQQAEGHVVLKNNSTLDLSSEPDAVLLNDYSFAAYDETQGAAPTAQISIDADAVNAEAATGTHIKGSKLTVDSNLVEDGSKLNLALEADDLTLGGGTDYVSANKSLGFSHATVHNSVTFTPDSGSNADLTLGAGVDFVATDDTTGAAEAATSSGNVVLSGNEHGYNVKVGNVTHHGNMTLDNANITIGGDSTHAGKDASLAFSGAQPSDKVNFTIDNTNGENKITIAGNGLDDSGNFGHASLDLTNTNLTVTRGDNYLSSITVGNSAQQPQQPGGIISLLPSAPDSELKVTGEQFAELIKADAQQGVGVVINRTGQVNISGDTAFEVGALVQGSNASNSTVSFNEGGILNVDGAVTLSNANGQTADLGKGTLNTKGMKLSGADTTFAFQSGTVNVDVSAQQTPPATDPVVALGGAADTDIGQTVQLGDGTQTQDVTFNFKGADGTNYAINADLALNGTDSGSANVNLESGNWTAQNIKVSGAANNIQIGTTPAGGTNNTNLTVNDVTLDQGANLAVTGNKLTVTGEANFLQGSLNGDAKLEVNGEGAQAQLTTTNFKDFVTKDDADPSDTESSVTLASGGKLYLQGAEKVTLTSSAPAQAPEHTFVIDADPTNGSGDIHVSGTHGTDPNNTIAADNLAVTSNLNNGTGLALDLAATNLTLGGDANYNNTQGFGFDTADTRNVTFEASADPNNTSGSVVLREQLNLQSTTNDQTVADVGNSSGDVTINGGTKSYHVLYGNYTHNGNMTVSGGTLDVGYSSADGTTAPLDASLAVNGNFKLNNTAGANTINVNCHSGASATLDLTNATNDAANPILDRGANLTTINVGNVAAGAGTVTNDQLGDSTLKVTGDQLEQLLTDADPSSSDSGAAIVLGAKGTLDVTNKANDAAVNLDLDKVLSGSTASDGHIIFNDGGTLKADDLILSSANKSELNIGAGTIASNSLALNGNTSGAGSSFVVNNGNLLVNEKLSSNAETIQIGNGGTSASLTLGSFGQPDSSTGLVDQATLSPESGSIASNLVVSGAFTPENKDTSTPASYGAQLNVDHGNWSIKDGSGDLSATGTHITIGVANANDSGNAYKATDDAGNTVDITASLSGNTLSLTNSQLTVNKAGTAIFNTLTSSGNADIDINGYVTVHNSLKLSSGAGDSVTISGPNATLDLGANLVANSITVEQDKVTIASDTFNNVFTLVSGGNLKLDFDDNIEVNTDNIASLRKQLIVGSDGSTMKPNEQGYIHLGGAKITGITEKIERPIGDYNPGDAPSLSIDGEDVSEILADIKDIRTDELDNVVLTEITDDTINANVGALKLSGSGTTATIQDATLSHAYDPDTSTGNDDRYFIYNDKGELGGAHVIANGKLALENGGHIGDIVLEAGSSADTPTSLVVNEGTQDYGDGTTYISSVSGDGANTKFVVNDVTEVAGNVTIGQLENGSTLNVSGDSTIAQDYTNNGTAHHSGSLSVGGKLNQNSNLTVDNGLNVGGNTTFAANSDTTVTSGDASFNGDAILNSGANVTVSNGTANFSGTTTQASGSNLNGANITFNGPTTLGGNTTATGDVTATGTDFILEASGVITSSGKGDITANTINLAGNANFTGDVNLSGTTTQASGSSLNGANITFNAPTTTLGGSTTATSNVMAMGTEFTLAAGGSLNASGSGTFNTEQTYLNGNASFGGDVTINGTTTAQAAGSLNGANITFNASTTTLLGSTTATGNVMAMGTDFTLEAGGSINASGSGTFNTDQTYINGNASFGGDVTFNGTTTAQAAGSLNGANITFNASTTTLLGSTTATGNVTASGDAFNLMQGGVITSSGKGEITANIINLAGDANFSGDVTLAGTVNQTAGSLKGANLTINGENITLGGNNTFTGSGNIETSAGPGTKIDLAVSNNFTGDLTVTAETITTGQQLTAANGTFNGNTTFKGANTFNGDLTLSGSTTISSGSTVTVEGDILTFNGHVTQEAGSALQATSPNNVTTFNNNASGDTTSTLAGNNSFNEVNFNGDFDHTGTLAANTMNVDGTFNLSASGDITTLNAASGSTVNLFAQGNTIDTLNGASGAVVQVGNDGGSGAGTPGSVDIQTLNLNGGTLFVDPDYGQQASLAAVTKGVSGGFSGQGTVLNGNIVVGKNAAVAWGEGLDTLANDIKAYQDANGSLKNGSASGNYGSIFVVNQPLTVQDGYHITLNSAETTSDLASADAISKLSNGNTADLTLSDQSALIVKIDAVGGTSDNATTAIHFDKSEAAIKSTGGEIVLAGNYDGRTYINLFGDNGASGNEGVRLEGENINVYSQNHILKATLESGDNVGYNVKLAIDQQRFNKQFYQASNPVKQTLIDYYAQSQPTTGSNAYLNDAVQTDMHGLAAEQAARLGVYGGTVQSAMAVTDSQTDAIARRTGVGEAAPGGSSFAAKGATAFWATPVYKRAESDGFDAQGVSYGSDVDLYGLAAGAELTLAPNFKVGGLVNFGQGSADGNGIASGVSNDFDYWGLGAYLATKYNNFTLVGDLNYTSVSNDIDASNSIDKINTSVDSTTLSLGVTGKMDLKVQGFNVAPHAGLRFQRIDMDDYSVASAKHGQVGSYSADTMNLFSLPVGVTVSKDFITSSGWQLKPAVDLTLTANFGDTDADGSMAWTGTNQRTGLSSEVVDPFTVGINAGISVKKGNFSAGAGVNYTGSSNTDEFGVQANVRFEF